jgi:uncharacterized protein (DUF2147 family)
MRQAILISVAIFICTISNAQDQALGMYFTPEKDGKIQIYKEGNKYFGKIVPINNNNRKDINNPDEKLRSQPLAGLAFMKNFEYNGKEWENGTIYDPDNGKTYSSSMWFENNDYSKLKVRGFIGFSLLGRTAVFERVP